MTVRFLRAEELARHAGVAKSTVLAAIRRGEIESSRTVGRGTRIALDTARRYLEGRGRPIPPELRNEGAWYVAVITEDPDLISLVRRSVPGSWLVSGSRESYGTLLWIGTHAPGVIVVDLDAALLHPYEIIRAVRSQPALAASRVVALGSHLEALQLARVLGANDAALKRRGDDSVRELAQVLSG
jgi:excisionase family DNA binding protein